MVPMVIFPYASMSRENDIVGLKGEEGSRSCESHDVCENHMNVVDLVKIKVKMSLVGEEEKVVINNRDDNETCHVGFLPRHIVYGIRKDKLRKS
jgi:hypothetical protein